MATLNRVDDDGMVHVARDPLSALLGAGERWDLLSLCVAVAVALHAGLLLFAIVSGRLGELRLAVDQDRARLHELLFRQYEVEVDKPKDEPRPEPPQTEPPPPEPAPAPKLSQKPAEADPYTAPVPAKAAPVVTQEPRPDEPVDLTHDGFVTGDGNALGGMQSGKGTGDRVTLSKAASNEATPGGKGKAPAPAPPPSTPTPTEDRSRAVQLVGGNSWSCPFPPEADADQIDQAVVGVQVTVRPDGTAASAVVVSDPGHGFGRASRTCALGKRYQPALDRAGEPITGGGLVNVRFSR